MQITIPRFPVYGTGLVLVVLLAIVFGFVSNGTSEGEFSGPWMFAAGLIIGHLVGAVLSGGSSSRTAAQTTVTLYVGNLAYRTTQDDVWALFQRFGQVRSVRLMVDKATGKSRGYGFVVLEEEAARAALRLNGTEFNGRTLRVSAANDRQELPQNA